MDHRWPALARADLDRLATNRGYRECIDLARSFAVVPATADRGDDDEPAQYHQSGVLGGLSRPPSKNQLHINQLTWSGPK